MRRLTSVAGFLALAAAVSGGPPGSPRPAFEPFPGDTASRYRFDLTRIFATPEAEKSDRAALERELEEFGKLRSRVAADARGLLEALNRQDALQRRFFRHSIYLTLRYAVDTRRPDRDEASALDDEVKAKTAFCRDELLRLPMETFSRFVAQEPGLERYRYALSEIRRYAPHTLSVPEEKVLATTESLGEDWPFDLYRKLIARTRFETVEVDGRSLDVNRDRLLIASGAPPDVRGRAFKARYAGFDGQRDLYAFLLLRLASARNALARERHFHDAAEQSYFDRGWTKEDVTSLLGRVAQAAPVYERYQRLRAQHVKRTMGYADVNVWDLSARPVGEEPPRFTIEEARRILLDATVRLGPEYHSELEVLLDPANGRMDVVPGRNRQSGGFSRGFAGTESVFFSAGFTGSYNDVRVLAHESTHAVQRQLMNRHDVPAAYFDGPHYLSEALAITNELILADHLARQAKDPAEKRFFLEQFFDGKGMEAFAVAPEAELEQAVYDGVAAGTIKTADDLDALTVKTYSRFSIWPAKHPEMKSQWMCIPLMYEDPFYDVNYVYGALVGLRLFSLFQKDPASFAAHYVGMMAHGYDAPAEELLRRTFGFDLHDPSLLPDAVSLLNARVDELERAYRGH